MISQTATSDRTWECTLMTLISHLPPKTLTSCFQPCLMIWAIWSNVSILKTKCLLTGTRHKISLLYSDPYIFLDRHSIERINSFKCLGIQVDGTLSWEAHISKAIGEVAKVLAALRKLRSICPLFPNPLLFRFQCKHRKTCVVIGRHPYGFDATRHQLLNGSKNWSRFFSVH